MMRKKIIFQHIWRKEKIRKKPLYFIETSNIRYLEITGTKKEVLKEMKQLTLEELKPVCAEATCFEDTGNIVEKEGDFCQECLEFLKECKEGECDCWQDYLYECNKIGQEPGPKPKEFIKTGE